MWQASHLSRCVTIARERYTLKVYVTFSSGLFTNVRFRILSLLLFCCHSQFFYFFHVGKVVDIYSKFDVIVSAFFHSHILFHVRLGQLHVTTGTMTLVFW